MFYRCFVIVLLPNCRQITL